MHSFLPHHLENLKNCVLIAAGLTSIMPCDCKTLSALIWKKTHQRVSETTLKRVYGFAYSKFSPSLFTIDTLSKYCDYDSWKDFCAQQEKPVKKPCAPNWELFRDNANRVTGYTLRVLKNRTGIPYNYTINRNFMDVHMDAFLCSKQIGTILCAPAGYGKTTALCHWIDRRIEQNANNDCSDIILFFSSSVLINVFQTGRSLDEWILSLLGMVPDFDLAELLNSKKSCENKFFLIIDGLDECMFKPHDFQNLLNELSNISSLYNQTGWFKIVITLRLSSWQNLKNELAASYEKWFLGFTTHQSIAVNIPLLNAAEIEQICDNIKPGIVPHDANQADLTQKFSFPLFLQSYYQKYKSNFCLAAKDHMGMFELVADFILNKVYTGPQSSEKVLLLRALIMHMRLPAKHFSVSKLAVSALLEQYQQPYQYLLSAGILLEINRSSPENYNTVIEFSNADFLTYGIAKRLLLDNRHEVEPALNDAIKLYNDDEELKLPVLKWLIIYAVKSNQFVSLKSLPQIPLQRNEKAELASFIFTLINNSGDIEPQLNEFLFSFFNWPANNYRKVNSYM